MRLLITAGYYLCRIRESHRVLVHPRRVPGLLLVRPDHGRQLLLGGVDSVRMWAWKCNGRSLMLSVCTLMQRALALSFPMPVLRDTTPALAGAAMRSCSAPVS
jgi:hypothetical protein